VTDVGSVLSHVLLTKGYTRCTPEAFGLVRWPEWVLPCSWLTEAAARGCLPRQNPVRAGTSCSDSNIRCNGCAAGPRCPPQLQHGLMSELQQLPPQPPASHQRLQCKRLRAQPPPVERSPHQALCTMTPSGWVWKMSSSSSRFWRWASAKTETVIHASGGRMDIGPGCRSWAQSHKCCRWFHPGSRVYWTTSTQLAASHQQPTVFASSCGSSS